MDKKEFARLFKRYKPLMCHKLWNKTRNSDMVKDLLHDIFLKAYTFIYIKKRNISFLTEHHFRQWLMTITDNTLSTNIRRHIKVAKREREIAASDIEDFALTKATNIELVEENNAIKKLCGMSDEMLNALNKLSQPRRNIVILRYFHDYKVKEISQLLNIPQATVLTRLHRARNILKTQLRG